MYREIKFRAKIKDSFHWVYGELHQNCKRPHIHGCQNQSFDINKDTIGQFTGKRSRNKEDVYEGDILKDDDGNLYIVEYNEADSAFSIFSCSEKIKDYIGYYNIKDKFDVIGNIYDNKDLLED